MKTEAQMEAHRLATRKLADKYVGRAGEPPSVLSRVRSARDQDLNEDDRTHLKWCLRTIRTELAPGSLANEALGFLEALLNRDYGLDKNKQLGGAPAVDADKEFWAQALQEEMNRDKEFWAQALQEEMNRVPRPRKSRKGR